LEEVVILADGIERHTYMMTEFHGEILETIDSNP
jgi:hypothetical protein